MSDAQQSDAGPAMRRAVYDYNADCARDARVSQGAYGRLAAALLGVSHLVILAMALAGGEGTRVAEASLGAVAGAGLALALASGLAGWAHAGLSANLHGEWADTRLLDPRNADEIAPPRTKKRLADVAVLIQGALGGLSGLAVACAAWALL